MHPPFWHLAPMQALQRCCGAPCRALPHCGTGCSAGAPVGDGASACGTAGAGWMPLGWVWTTRLEASRITPVKVPTGCIKAHRTGPGVQTCCSCCAGNTTAANDATMCLRFVLCCVVA